MFICGAEFSGTQVNFAGSTRLTQGDRVVVTNEYPGPAELRGRRGEITKHRGLGKFVVKLDTGETTSFDAKYLKKSPRQ